MAIVMQGSALQPVHSQTHISVTMLFSFFLESKITHIQVLSVGSEKKQKSQRNKTSLKYGNTLLISLYL